MRRLMTAAVLAGVLAADAAAQLPVAPPPSNPGKVRGTLADGTEVLIDAAVWAAAPLADAPAPAAYLPSGPQPTISPRVVYPAAHYAPPVVLGGGCTNGRCFR